MAICCGNCHGNTNGCKWCGATGLCCPSCRGVGWLKRVWSIDEISLVRCRTCHFEGEFHASNTMRAILQYIEDWFDGHIADEVESRRRECERVKAETEARRKASEPVWKHG